MKKNIMTLLLTLPVTTVAATDTPLAKAARGFDADTAYSVQRDYDSNRTPAADAQTVYMYLNMPQFFPHQLVPRSGVIRELPLKLDARIGRLSLKTKLGERTLDALLDDPRSGIQGYIVIQHGNIVYERYPGMRPNDNHLWWSSSKAIAGLIAAQMVAEGKLDPGKTIEQYLPEFAASGWKGTPLRDLVDQASGIDAEEATLESYASPKSQLSRLVFAERILAPPPGVPVLTHNEALLSMTRKRPPGEVFEYSSANTNVLALIVERASGQRYADLVAERIWSRIGAEGDALLGLTPQGNAIAHGMFSSRLRDMARFGIAFTPSGRKGIETPAVSAQVLDMIEHDGRPQLFAKGGKAATLTQTFGEAPVSCAWQWDAAFADGDLYKGGFHGQGLYVSPSRDAVVGLFSTSNEGVAPELTRAVLLDRLFAPQASP
jgi:CubicO group peptidase (beta-lactamase class C family)